MKNKSHTEQRQKEDIKRLAGYAFHFPLHLSLGILFLLMALGAELIAPFAVRRIFDEELLKETIDKRAIFHWLKYYVAANFLGAIFQYVSNIQLQMMAMKIVQKMRMQIFTNLQRIGISFFDTMPAGSIVSKVTNDTGAVQTLYVKVLGQVVTSMLYIIGIYIVIFSIQPKLAALLLVMIPLISLCFYWYVKKARSNNFVIRAKLSELNGIINESVQGIRIIQAFNSQKKVHQEFENTANQRFAERMKLLLLNVSTTYNMVSAFKNIVYMLMVYYFGSRVVKNVAVTSVGMLYVYIDYIGLLFHHINRIMEQLNEFSRSSVASVQVFELIDKEGKDVSDEKLEKIQGEVSFEQVSFSYKEGEYVLRDVNIQAKKGETVALVGHTGSGKSSIMNLLLKFYEPQQGKILVDGLDLKKLPDQAIRSHMGIVLQEPYLFTGTILSNITLNKPQITREMAERALSMIGGEVVLRTLKKGIDEPVVERGATLSSGQRQLISFARALAQNPSILILDEATSSVDSETEQIIQSAMDVLMKGRTTFVIAHRLSTIKNADRIYLLEKGKVIESGTHDELIALKSKYYEMYETQKRQQAEE